MYCASSDSALLKVDYPITTIIYTPFSNTLGITSKQTLARR